MMSQASSEPRPRSSSGRLHIAASLPNITSIETYHEVVRTHLLHLVTLRSQMKQSRRMRNCMRAKLRFKSSPTATDNDAPRLHGSLATAYVGSTPIASSVVCHRRSCRLTNRSSGPTKTARILRAQNARRLCGPLNSDVRPHETMTVGNPNVA